MAYCSNCGIQLNEGAKFCPNCGNKVENGTTSPQQEDVQYQDYEDEELKTWQKIISVLCWPAGVILTIYMLVKERSDDAIETFKYTIAGILLAIALNFSLGRCSYLGFLNRSRDDMSATVDSIDLQEVANDTVRIDEENADEDVSFSTPEESTNLDWLQGHWVYEQGNYQGHFIIRGDEIIQYSSMNPEHYSATYRIVDNELRAKLIDGMDLIVKIDPYNQSIDYGDGQWMHKME